ncbi:MAG: ATP-binding cassette domain-containing protein [Pseudomonadota bacterium]
MTTVLSLRGVVGARGDGFRVEAPALDLDAGEAIAVVGPSGSGKSTMLDILAGLLSPAEAERFECRAAGATIDLAAAWRRGDVETVRRYRAKHVGYVMQTGGLVPFLTVAENVALPFWRDGLAMPEEAGAVLADLGIEKLAGRAPRAVSVGERQRAAIARALVRRPSIVLADEPTAALDQDRAEAVMALLVREARERGAALIVVTHDRALAERHGLRLAPCESAGAGRSRLSEGRAAA